MLTPLPLTVLLVKESMLVFWEKINLDEEIKHGVIDRDLTSQNQVLNEKWKYLFRK